LGKLGEAAPERHGNERLWVTCSGEGKMKCSNRIEDDGNRLFVREEGEDSRAIGGA
jgi:mannose-6-phosphate isomerase-like protein (cupin superfamily)